uniref:Putative site-specific DNA endonuclease n=1 Tax=Stigeoclonium helveticum TaxID=55999 RepID=Q06SK1_STIHE|nr:putative site-specific DNA endonuclease [Stigeoclonium helveticum]ABF60215.1 putative site-specific DNA endonuclease [Stigeoclonium helveticum]
MKTKNSALSNKSVVQGFFDADGSFQAKVYSGKRKPISFHVNIIFSQREKEVLAAVLNSLNSTSKISEREIINDSGTESIGNSISLAFSNEAGQLLRKLWETNPPNAPTKYLDYCIAKILFQVSESSLNTAENVVNKLLPNLGLQDEKVAGLALLYLRYRMFGATKNNKNPKLKPIEDYYELINATQDQIDQSISIGQQLYEPIKQSYESRQSNIQISKDYLLGYHIGDGSFWIQSTFGEECQSFRVNFSWSVTDCQENLPLLKAIKTKLESHNIAFPKSKKGKESGIADYTTYSRLQISSLRACLKWVKLLGEWDWKDLPQVRQNQYDLFLEALEIYTLPNFRSDLSLLERIIHIKWSLNPHTNYKKKGSLEGDLEKVRTYFHKTN